MGEDHIFVATSNQIGADLEGAYTETLLPSRCNVIVTHLAKADRVILVGTHQALEKIRRTAGDEANPAYEISGELLALMRETFDLIIVDEGHYEPAVSWSRGVREFNLPTVLLSATPYRNDYKSFRVRGRFLFNYPYADAVRQRIIRSVEIVEPPKVKAGHGDDAVKNFVKMLKAELPSRIEEAKKWFKTDTVPKIMVRADDLDKLVALQSEIDRVFKTGSVLIHDRARKTEHNKNRFTSVASAWLARPDAQFWIHQFKLMEGIDDPSFVALSIFDLMGNARQLVQQIGRVTRHSNGDRRLKQISWVFATPSNAERIQTSWSRYLAYETYEPPRDCRRPQLLRGRACYEQDNKQVRTGGSPAGGTHGAGSRS